MKHNLCSLHTLNNEIETWNEGSSQLSSQMVLEGSEQVSDENKYICMFVYDCVYFPLVYNVCVMWVRLCF